MHFLQPEVTIPWPYHRGTRNNHNVPIKWTILSILWLFHIGLVLNYPIYMYMYCNYINTYNMHQYACNILVYLVLKAHMPRWIAIVTTCSLWDRPLFTQPAPKGRNCIVSWVWHSWCYSQNTALFKKWLQNPNNLRVTAPDLLWDWPLAFHWDVPTKMAQWLSRSAFGARPSSPRKFWHMWLTAKSHTTSTFSVGVPVSFSQVVSHGFYHQVSLPSSYQ